jgi:hypothetical protein
MVLIMLLSTISVSASYIITPPAGLGTLHTYTPWDEIRWGYNCKDLINFVEAHNAISDSYGIVTYGDYFAGALTSTYGKVGDMLLVVEEDNFVYPIIMADTKSQRDKGCTKWGHHYGKCMVEFEILSYCRKNLYGTSGGYISDLLAKPIIKVINLGSVYDDTKYFYDVEQACLDNGLEGYQLLINPYETITVKQDEILPVQSVTYNTQENFFVALFKPIINFVKRSI